MTNESCIDITSAFTTNYIESLKVIVVGEFTKFPQKLPPSAPEIFVRSMSFCAAFNINPNYHRFPPNSPLLQSSPSEWFSRHSTYSL